MLSLIPIKTEEAVLVAVILVLLSLLLYKHWKGQPAEVTAEKPGEGLGIDHLIEQVKHDLEAADKQTREARKAPLFKVENFSLEINFIVRESQSLNAGVKYEVVTVDSKTDLGRENVQKIVLQFKAIDYSNMRGEMPADGEFVPVPPNARKK